MVVKTRERWKEVPFFSMYEVSTWGKIRNKKTKRELSRNTYRNNYIRTSLINDDKKTKQMTLHRLVAITFLPNPKNKQTVNHKDHDPSNNHLFNLEWATTNEQNSHKRKIDKEKHKLISSRRTCRIDPVTNEVLEEYISIRDAAKWVFDNKLTKVKSFNNGQNIKSAICSVCMGKQNMAYSYKWKYSTTDQLVVSDDEWYNIPSHLIDGKEGYRISKCGKIKNKTGRVSKGYHKPNDYVWVSIYPKQYLLHILMAKVFLPNPSGKPYVNHKDCDKTNANLDNLEWCTPSENTIHYLKYTSEMKQNLKHL